MRIVAAACCSVRPKVVAVVVGETEAAARAGARAVVVTYEDLRAVMSIEEAIEAGSFYDDYKGKVRTI
jgi:xanthine dehydrogenase/oxidase